MLYRHIAVAVLASLVVLPAAAANRGELFLENREYYPRDGRDAGYALWTYAPGWQHTYMVGWPLLYKAVPLAGPGDLLAPASNHYVLHSRRTVSMWNGRMVVFTSPEKPQTDIFTAETDLGEIAPMRNGNFLVPERFNDREKGAKLIEFNAYGVVRTYAFPELADVPNRRNIGARHIELLADQCTLLYTLGNDHAMNNSVRRMNICTGLAMTDFATLLTGEYAGTIRALPNGDVIVANGRGVMHFNAGGSYVRAYQFPGVTRLALDVDGSGFWAAGVQFDQGYLRRFDLKKPHDDPPSVRLGNPEMSSLSAPVETTGLVMVGEWRASTATTGRKARVVRR